MTGMDDAQEDDSALKALLDSPVFHLLAHPAHLKLSFAYGDQQLVLVGRNEAGLALVARALGVGKVRRAGRSGARTWHVDARPDAQLPKPGVAVKRR